MEEQLSASAYQDSNLASCIATRFQPAKYHLPTASFINTIKKKSNINPRLISD
ncbi:hypothetical protein KXQ82_09920 [Mucilaginibacter sp. HMF5004]|uniref:hypothetical protein n=1 Tax=Mucilaginibacter rivuli TaxID=2857527 RepID=UPI001C5F843C|nr:hypothetical protein [Mucilaginibacter rivuli]MBW4890035.1 hypothetical protein [Mucilaginibacter rivuli]